MMSDGLPGKGSWQNEEKSVGTGIKSPVSREYLEVVQLNLYETIKKAEDSWDPNVSLAGIAILAKYEKLVDLLRDIKDYGLEVKKW